VQETTDEITHLERLAAALTRSGLTARLVTSGRRPQVQAANPDTPRLTERVLCKQASDGRWRYWWPWRQPIGPVEDLDAVVGKIAAVLRSVAERP
jgi:hypothetical protein